MKKYEIDVDFRLQFLIPKKTSILVTLLSFSSVFHFYKLVFKTLTIVKLKKFM